MLIIEATGILLRLKYDHVIIQNRSSALNSALSEVAWAPCVSYPFSAPVNWSIHIKPGRKDPRYLEVTMVTLKDLEKHCGLWIVARDAMALSLYDR